MKQHRIFSILVILALLLALMPAGEAPVQAQAPETEITRDTLYVPGEVVVGFDRDLPRAEAQTRAAALAGSVGAMVVDQYANMALLSVDPAADVFTLAERLTAQDGVAYAEPNYISWIPEEDPLGAAVQLSEVTRQREDGTTITRSVEELKAMRTVINGKVQSTYPNDEYRNWGNSAIQHEIIWPNKNASPVVCVIDTGADDRHPDLKGQIIKGYDFVNNDKVPNDDNGHGTHVSGTIAAKVNNGIGPAGISNGKVLAVKALNAQGWGTDFDIAAAIRYCADNKSVKVINMSLGGPGTATKYNALKYAINDKEKLVVAAAGNDSTSYYNYPEYEFYAYPAAWAYSGVPGFSEPNTIHQGLLSVGASRKPFYSWYDDMLWVDTDGDDEIDEDEYYNRDYCATDFSNYGEWVEMIAPGESIYSTLPVSYPFWNNFYSYSSSGYDWWDGTSMAAPHVAGAAARTWSVFPKESNMDIHDRLINSGYEPTIAEDPNMDDPNMGYNNEGYGFYYDEEDYTYIKAPFCWPALMSNARILNVAAAMERGGLFAEVTDATTGLPLTGATVSAKNSETGKTLATARMTDMRDSSIELINIPALDSEDQNIRFTLSVNMKGYTAGYQPFSWGWVHPGRVVGYSDFLVGVPPKSSTTVVASWLSGGNLDLFAFLPAGAPSGVVGSGESENDADVGPGNLRDFPRARWHRDGGNPEKWEWDDLGVEAITVANYPRSQYPYYLSQYPYGKYEFFLHDYNQGYDLENSYFPILRVWNNGKIVPIWMEYIDEDDEENNYYYLAYYARKTVTCNDSESWLKMLTIERNGSSPLYLGIDQKCGTGISVETDPEEGVWPYAGGNVINSVSSYGISIDTLKGEQ